MDFNKAANARALSNLNREFAEGGVSISTYNEKAKELKLKELDEDFKAGTLSVYDYNKAIIETSDSLKLGSAAVVGLSDYINSAGTLSQGVATTITSAFGHLEDQLTITLESGKGRFKDFADAVLKDLNRMILRALVIRTSCMKEY